jgi:hypothetical protein
MGTPLPYVRTLVEHGQHRFDRRVAEANLNRRRNPSPSTSIGVENVNPGMEGTTAPRRRTRPPRRPRAGEPFDHLMPAPEGPRPAVEQEQRHSAGTAAPPVHEVDQHPADLDAEVLERVDPPLGLAQSKRRHASIHRRTTALGVPWRQSSLCGSGRQVRPCEASPEIGDPRLVDVDRERGRGYFCFFEDDFGVAVREQIGRDMITFETHYPHQDSAWPHSLERVEGAVVGLPSEDIHKEDIHKMVRGNAIEMLHLDESLPASGAVTTR